MKFITKSTVYTVRYLLNNGLHFVLTRRFSSDDVERFFGSVRQMMGGNFQGNAYGVLTSSERILRTGIAYASVHSNVILRTQKERDYELILEKCRRKRARNELKFLTSSKLLVLNELLLPPSIRPYLFKHLSEQRLIILISRVVQVCHRDDRDGTVL